MASLVLAGLLWAPEKALGAKVRSTVPTLQVNDISFDEGQAGDLTEAVFTVALSEPTGKVVSVDLFTQDGTATGGTDYTRTSTTVVFPKRATAQQVTIEVLGDTLREDANESFYAVLAGASNARIGDGVGEATIIDDEYIMLFVETTGSYGDGTVSSDDGAISCGPANAGDCQESYRVGSIVTLSAEPDGSSFLRQWTVSDADNQPYPIEQCASSCTFELTTTEPTLYVTSYFGHIYPFTVVKDGDAASQGTVTSSPAGIDCGTTCTAGFRDFTNATFTATAAPGTHFVRWTDDGRCYLSTDPVCVEVFNSGSQEIPTSLTATFAFD